MGAYQYRIRPHEKTVKLVYKLIDVVSFAIAMALMLVWFPHADSQSSVVTCLLACGVFMLAAEVFGLYQSWQSTSVLSQTRSMLISLLTTLLILIAVGYYSQSSTELSGHALLVWFAIMPLVALTGRLALRALMTWFVSNDINTRKYAIVGANELGLHLARSITASPDLGLKFIGFYDDRPESRTMELPPEYDVRLGDVQELIADARRLEIETVFVALPMRAELRIRELIQSLADAAISVYFVPDLFVFQLLHSRWTDVHGIPVVSVYENPLYGVDGFLKRVFDLAMGTVILSMAAIPMVFIAALIKLTSRGPVFFRQRRYGLDGREFFVWKFRSMTVCEDGANVQQATKNDRRVTWIGGIIRKTSLDELPQLFNVLGGTMSLVGPRPHATAHNELYRTQIQGYMLRHKIKPGITGLAQVNGCRGETETLDKMERRVHFDHQYIREWSMWLDVRILFQTFKIVFKGQNAY
jgi:putative colanic acid biosynthesis UDP-glucose lipid carrier transferase